MVRRGLVHFLGARRLDPARRTANGVTFPDAPLLARIRRTEPPRFGILWKVVTRRLPVAPVDVAVVDELGAVTALLHHRVRPLLHGSYISASSSCPGDRNLRGRGVGDSSAVTDHDELSVQDGSGRHLRLFGFQRAPRPVDHAASTSSLRASTPSLLSKPAAVANPPQLTLSAPLSAVLGCSVAVTDGPSVQPDLGTRCPTGCSSRHDRIAAPSTARSQMCCARSAATRNRAARRVRARGWCTSSPRRGRERVRDRPAVTVHTSSRSAHKAFYRLIPI